MKHIIKDDSQLAALISSLAILMASLGYWVIQIQSVREMLTMAYG